MVAHPETESGVEFTPVQVERRTRRSIKRKILYGFITLVVVAIVLVASVIGFFVVREHRSPSGKVFVNTSQGKVELKVPDTMANPPTAVAAGSVPDAPSPPTTLDIPSIGVHAQVYLMTSDPPKTKAVGWLYGTAMPGTTGNMVFYGARDGATAVFDKVGQLQKGDKITVETGAATYVYRAISAHEVPANDTDILLPTSDAELTLITDAGEWDESIGGYTRRLVIKAVYESVKS